MIILHVSTYVAQADIFDESWVEVATFVHLLQQLDNNAIKTGILEATLSGFGERRTDSESDHNIISILCGALVKVSNL